MSETAAELFFFLLSGMTAQINKKEGQSTKVLVPHRNSLVQLQQSATGRVYVIVMDSVLSEHLSVSIHVSNFEKDCDSSATISLTHLHKPLKTCILACAHFKA